MSMCPSPRWLHWTTPALATATIRTSPRELRIASPSAVALCSCSGHGNYSHTATIRAGYVPFSRATAEGDGILSVDSGKSMACFDAPCDIQALCVHLIIEVVSRRAWTTTRLALKEAQCVRYKATS